MLKPHFRVGEGKNKNSAFSFLIFPIFHQCLLLVKPNQAKEQSSQFMSSIDISIQGYRAWQGKADKEEK